MANNTPDATTMVATSYKKYMDERIKKATRTAVALLKESDDLIDNATFVLLPYKNSPETKPYWNLINAMKLRKAIEERKPYIPSERDNARIGKASRYYAFDCIRGRYKAWKEQAREDAQYINKYRVTNIDTMLVLLKNCDIEYNYYSPYLSHGFGIADYSLQEDSKTAIRLLKKAIQDFNVVINALGRASTKDIGEQVKERNRTLLMEILIEVIEVCQLTQKRLRVNNAK